MRLFKEMNLDIKNSKDLRCEILSLKSKKLEVDYITLNISIEGHFDPKINARFFL